MRAVKEDLVVLIIHFRFEYELPPSYMPDDFEEHLKVQIMPHITIPGHLFR